MKSAWGCIGLGFACLIFTAFARVDSLAGLGFFISANIYLASGLICFAIVRRN